jgi:hypothetical protein
MQGCQYDMWVRLRIRVRDRVSFKVSAISTSM